MPSLRSVAAWTAIAGLVAASPVKRNDAFTLDRVHMGYKEKNGARSIANTFAKYGGVISEDVLKAAASNGTGSGSVTTTPAQYDALYLTPVNVGGTTLMLDFDTGSADLWVFSSELPSSQQSGHSVYKVDPSKKLSGASWDISYGDGSGARGDVYKDTVTVGPITVTSQAVEAAQSISAQFVQDKNNDGLLGLAFSTINTVSPQKQTTWFDTAFKAGDLKQDVFAAKLEAGKPGKYDFGFIDTSSYTGEVNYAPVNSGQGFWEFTTDGYAVGSKKSSTRITGIADTGTTLIYVSSAIVKDYYSQVSGAQYNSQAGGYTVPCNAQLPDFSISINGQLHTTPGEYINFAPAGGACFGGIQSNTGLQGLSIFGDVFLKSQYVVFDASKPQVGFAKQA